MGIYDENYDVAGVSPSRFNEQQQTESYPETAEKAFAYAQAQANPAPCGAMGFDENYVIAQMFTYHPAPCGAMGFDENYVIAQMFTYHPANMFTQPKFEAIREAAKYFAKVLLNNVPAGADRTAAIRKLREAVFTANAAISLGGLSL